MKRSKKTKSLSNSERSLRGSDSRRLRRGRMVRTRCYFDEKGTDPTYHDFETLSHFLTKRGKIRPRTRSGLCAKHQRLIAREIKRARNLSLLPYRIIG